MKHPLLAAKTGGQFLGAAIGGGLMLLIVVAAEYRAVTDVVALLLLIGIPAAALVDAARENLRELRDRPQGG